MIAALIFLLHFIGCIYAFAKYKKEEVSEGLLAVAFVIIIFSVGWTISTMISKIIYPDDLSARWVQSLQGTYFSRLLSKEITIDTFSLILLTIGEAIFYRYCLRSEATKVEPEKKAK